MALVILGPAAVAGWEAIQRFSDPFTPDVVPVVEAVRLPSETRSETAAGGACATRPLNSQILPW
jgi:hypothetical protein